MSSRTSSATNSRYCTTCSGVPAKRRRSSGSCVAMPTGQVLRWQTRIMMQPAATSGAVEKPNSSAPSSAPTMTSRPVRRPPSTCSRTRPRSALPTSTCCVSARPSSQGTPACRIDDVRRGAGAAVDAGDHDVVGAGLGDARGDGADARERDELDADLGRRVDAAQVVDQLGEILDRVDVVVRRRRDQADARRRVAQARDLDVDLVARQLAALAGLGALRDLDLEHVGVDQVGGRHAEARRGHLLDRRAPRVAVRVGVRAPRVLAALAAVRAAAEAVHRDRERLVGLLARSSRATSRPTRSASRSRSRARPRRAAPARPPGTSSTQAAQRTAEPVLLVGGLANARVALGALVAHGALQRDDDLGVPDVALAAQAVGVDAARVELAAGQRMLVAAPRRPSAIPSRPMPPTRDGVPVK